MRDKLLELIETQTDTYAYRDIVNSNYSISELADILNELIKFNEYEKMENEENE